MPSKLSMTPKEALQVERMWSVYDDASREAADALPADGTPLDPQALKRFKEADARARQAIKRIREIQREP
jgi:hypothetical protein